VEERLHKRLAQAGLGSRRQVEDWIRAGRVQVNGRPAELGQRVKSSDRVTVDGRDVSGRLTARPALRVIVCHKPGGQMSRSREGDDREAVESRLPTLRSGRWLPVNALGYGEEGVLVLTNDGTLVTAIARRQGSLEVEYRVRVLRPKGGEAWPEMPTEIDVDGAAVDFTAVERLESPGTNVWFRVTADRPPRRGALRALFDAAGLKVGRVLLVRWGPVLLPRDLPRGRTRALEGADLDALLALAGRSVAEAGARPRATRRRSAPRGAAKPRDTGR
jgi:23S rRNA pseudouridine2605 synthase